MHLFLKLVLAHLIGDFILQFEELFRLKVKSLWGHLLHAVTHAIVSLLILWPYLDLPSIWVFVLSASAIHGLQDIVKYRAMNNRPFFFLIFVADQIGHFLILATVLLFPVSGEFRVILDHPTVNALYVDDTWTLYAILFMLTTFTGNFLFHAFSTSYLPRPRRDYYITTFEIVHGIVERSLVTGLFLLSGSALALAFSPAIGAVRMFFRPIKDPTDFLLSFNYAALLGLLFRLWI
jgi:hypothetical protein